MPRLADYADLLKTWRKGIGSLPRAPLRDPSVEEFFLICEAMALFDEAHGAYTLPAGESHLSDQDTWTRINIFHSVLARDFSHINERSAFLVPKANILIDHFNAPNLPIRDPINLSRVRAYFDGQPFEDDPQPKP